MHCKAKPKRLCIKGMEQNSKPTAMLDATGRPCRMTARFRPVPCTNLTGCRGPDTQRSLNG
jgi:hypothetical protein